MRNNFVLVMASFVVVLGLGCAKGNKLVGDWDSTIPGVGASVVSFAGDGSMTIVAAVAQMGPGAKETIACTYRLDGDKLYMTPKDVSYANLPPAAKSIESEMIAGAKRQMNAGTEAMLTVKFDGNDSFTATASDGGAISFKRKVREDKHRQRDQWIIGELPPPGLHQLKGVHT
ncbi:MAG: hypothetical protein ACHQ50_06020 [Fimbriimonadales bacterium]